MEIANCTLWLTNAASFQKLNITPAEAMLLASLHASNNGRVADIKLIHDVPRSNAEELNRLLQHYRFEDVNGPSGLWPGATPIFPTTFESANLATTPFVATPQAPPITSFPQPPEWIN